MKTLPHYPHCFVSTHKVQEAGSNLQHLFFVSNKLDFRQSYVITRNTLKSRYLLLILKVYENKTSLATKFSNFSPSFFLLTPLLQEGVVIGF